MISLFKKKECCDKPSFGKWSEEKELYTSDSFSSSALSYQVRVCENCGFQEKREIAYVRSGR